MPKVRQFQLLGYSTALIVVLAVLVMSAVTANAGPETRPMNSTWVPATVLPPTALAAATSPAGPSPAWSADDFSLSASERHLLDRLTRDRANALAKKPPPDCSVLKCVALTFDDGPSLFTGALLAVLANHDVPATFFVVGKSARALPAELLQIQAAGHEIALHSDRHQRMPTLSNAAIVRDFERSRQTLRELTGLESELYRPPYGMHSARVGKLAHAAVIMWDVDPQDWRVRNSRQITQRVLTRVKPGSIVLLHELAQTAGALNSLITELIARGYTLVTVSEVLGEEPIHSKIYRHGVVSSQSVAAG
jgi:peptidoglycan/xylan/chitin deacetylase (PgdA/CDA1 family)